VARGELERLGEPAGGEVVIAADARALLATDGHGEAVRSEHLVRHLERLLEADWPAQAVRADLPEVIVGSKCSSGSNATVRRRLTCSPLAAHRV
jgi:hypothetical protein